MTKNLRDTFEEDSICHFTDKNNNVVPAYVVQVGEKTIFIRQARLMTDRISGTSFYMKESNGGYRRFQLQKDGEIVCQEDGYILKNGFPPNVGPHNMVVYRR